MNNHLAGGPDGTGHAESADGVVESTLEQDQEVLSGVAFETAGFVDGTTELLSSMP